MDAPSRPTGIQPLVDAVLSDAEANRGLGEVASYIPALAQVSPRKLGITLGDGRSFAAELGSTSLAMAKLGCIRLRVRHYESTA